MIDFKILFSNPASILLVISILLLTPFLIKMKMLMYRQLDRKDLFTSQIEYLLVILGVLVLLVAIIIYLAGGR
jgi:hypothetical protein